MTTSTQDQLIKEFAFLMSSHPSSKDIWHWITTVYEPKVREEAIECFAKEVNDRFLINNRCIEKDGSSHHTGSMSILKIANIYKLERLSQLPTPDKDHE